MLTYFTSLGYLTFKITVIYVVRLVINIILLLLAFEINDHAKKDKSSSPQASFDRNQTAGKSTPPMLTDAR
jgi:hypothetical protein